MVDAAVAPSSARDSVRSRRQAAFALMLLLALFVFRVVAQLCQYFWPNDLLPPFSAWQSGLLPYPVLVMSQFVIIAAAIWAIVGVTRATLAPHRNITTALLIAGWVYFGAMALRLVAGLTLLKGTRFFGATLPAVFHLVLALLLIVLARHLRRTDRS